MTMFNPVKYFRNRKIGVALGSGGSKGLAHISILEFLKTEGIPINMISGSSIGAVIGALFSIGSLEDYRDDILRMDWKELIRLVDPVLPRSGLIEGKKIRAFLTRYIPENAKIGDLPIPLSVVSTDYYTGKPVVFTNGNLLDALRASIAIPGVFTPVKFGTSLLIDGGVSNPLPVDVLERMGAGHTIAVNLHPSLPRRRFVSSVKKEMEKAKEADAKELLVQNQGDHNSGELKISIRQLTKFLEKRKKKKERDEKQEPNIFDIIAQSVDIMEYMNTLMILKVYKPDVVIEPDLIGMPTLDFTNAARALAEGREACRKVRGQIVRKIKIWI